MHHIIELLSNPWIVALIIILFFGEYIPFSEKFWRKLGSLFHSLSQWFLHTYENSLYAHKDKRILEKKIHLKLNNIIARIIFFAISTLVVIFLEIFWELGFKGLTRTLERSGFAKWFEKKIQLMPSWAVLALFSLPFLFMEFLGIFALGAFIAGKIYLGISLYAIKVLLFIPVHFILHVGKEKLLAITWFERRYTIVVAVLAWFKTSQTYIKVHNFIQTIKAYIKAIKQMFERTITLLKTAFEHKDILSPECEEIRQEILRLQKEKLPLHHIYEKFFNCIDKHLQRSKK